MHMSTYMHMSVSTSLYVCMDVCNVFVDRTQNRAQRYTRAYLYACMYTCRPVSMMDSRTIFKMDVGSFTGIIL